MKASVIFLILLLVLPASADNVTSKRVVDLGTTKAVIFDETISPDGRYAMGWSLRPNNKTAKPVDWSAWNPDDADKFLDAYVPNRPDPVTEKDDYELINCVIDLKDKKFMELPADGPDYPHKNRGYIVAAWGPVGQGTRYALFESDERFYTDNLWLVTIDSKGMQQMDLADAFNKVADPIVRDKRPLNYREFSTFFSLKNDATPSRNVSFNGPNATIAFDSDVMKSEDDASMVRGTITFRLSDGKILQASSDTEKDDPLHNMSALAKADGQLNQIYSQLSQKLDPARRTDLKNEQLYWIDQRDGEAASALKDALQDANNTHDPHDARNKALLESTQKRVDELKSRLNALH